MIIVLCRNNLQLTKACVASLRRQRSPVGILAVDNASDDGTAQWLKAQGIFRISFRLPLSVARAWNWALGACWMVPETNEVLVVNNDTELLPETYSLLLERLKQDDHPGMVTGVGVSSRDQFSLGGKLEESRHPDYSSFMITRQTHKQVPFDEDFEGAFCEDCDHHVRLHRAGILAINTGIPFLHHGSATVKNAGAEEAEQIRQQADKNRQLFHEKWGRHIGTNSYNELFKEASFGCESTSRCNNR